MKPFWIFDFGFSIRSKFKRFIVLGMCVVLFALCCRVEAQQPKKIPRIGYVRFDGGTSRNLEAFRRGLRDLGYVEGENVAIEYRSADGKADRIPGLVADLVQLKVDVLMSGDDPTIHVAKRSTKTVPIVMVINQDPVAAGIVDSLARPGGNITGISRLTRELGGKRLELLTEVVPGLGRLGVLWDARLGRVKNKFGSSPYRVGDFDMILDRIEHARENLQTQVFLIA